MLEEQQLLGRLSGSKLLDRALLNREPFPICDAPKPSGLTDPALPG
jgi:hypothetical protein